MKKPMLLKFAATILFALGGFLIVSFVFALLKHEKDMASNFFGLAWGGAFMIYVADGLLKLKSRSRIAAMGFFGIFGLAFGWVFWMSVFLHADGDFFNYQMSWAVQAAISFFIAAVNIFSFSILTRRGIRDLFAKNSTVTT